MRQKDGQVSACKEKSAKMRDKDDLENLLLPSAINSLLWLLKGVWHEIFDFRFFSWIRVPPAPKYSIGVVLNCFEHVRRYLQMNVYHQCHFDTHGKLFSGVAGVVDTANKHSFAIISAKFRKNSKPSQWDTQGPGGHWFLRKKPEVENLASDSL